VDSRLLETQVSPGVYAPGLTDFPTSSSPALKVGPMVNRSVVVFGRWARQRGRKRKFHLKEIDLDEDAAD